MSTRTTKNAQLIFNEPQNPRKLTQVNEVTDAAFHGSSADCQFASLCISIINDRCDIRTFTRSISVKSRNSVHKFAPTTSIVNETISHRQQSSPGGGASHSGRTAQYDLTIFVMPDNSVSEEGKRNIYAVWNMAGRKFSGSTNIDDLRARFHQRFVISLRLLRKPEPFLNFFNYHPCTFLNSVHKRILASLKFAK